MSLVHRAEQVGADVVALECHACRTRYTGADLDVILDLGTEGDLRCLDPGCGTGGMIAHKQSRIEERFPPGCDWTSVPNCLLYHGGLGPHEKLVAWTLESYRRAIGDIVFPSHKRIARRTGLSIPSVKRALAKLADEGLECHPRFRDGEDEDGGRTSSGYTRDALWTRLATPSSHRPTPRSDRPRG